MSPCFKHSVVMGSGGSSGASEAAKALTVSRPVTVSTGGRRRRVELGLDQGVETITKRSIPNGTGVIGEPASTPPPLTNSRRDSGRIDLPIISPSAHEGLGTVVLFQGSSVGSWRRGGLLGKGAGGTVYEAVDEASNASFCVKMIEFDENFFESSAGRRRYENLQDEVLLMKTLRHRNIIRFLGLERRQLTMYILMELVPGGSLSDLIRKVGPLPDTTAAKLTVQLLDALVFIGQQGVVHRDIKGANILISVDGTLKLGDFGASKRLSFEPIRTMAGTPYWMAPEVVRQEGCSPAADVWSLGCTVVEMLTGAPPFHRLPPMQAMFKIGEGKDDPLSNIAQPLSPSPSLHDFLQLCLKSNPLDRSSAESLLGHPWITQVMTPLVEEPPKPTPSRVLGSGGVEWSLTDRPVQGVLQELARPSVMSSSSLLYMSARGVDSQIRSLPSISNRSLRQSSESSTATAPMSAPPTRTGAARNTRTFKAVLEARGGKIAE